MKALHLQIDNGTSYCTNENNSLAHPDRVNFQ